MKHIITTLLTILLLNQCAEESIESKNIEQIYKEEGVPVKTQIVKPELFTKYLNFYTTITGIEESSAFAAIADEVEKIFVKVGDYVEKDDVLLKFPEDNPAANFKQAKANYENAEAAYQRIENLYQNGGISQQNRDNAKTGYEVAKANWETVSQMINVKAPISGYVTKINVRTTDNVDSKTELVTISNLKKMKAKVWVPDKDIQQFRVDMPVTINRQGQIFTGKTVQIDFAMNSHKQAFGVTVEINNPDLILKTGTTVELDITTYSNSQALVVEQKNIISENDQHFVFLNSDGYAKKQLVQLGKRQGIINEVISGFAIGDELIIEGQILLESDSKLNVVN